MTVLSFVPPCGRDRGGKMHRPSGPHMFGFARPAGPNHWPKEDSRSKKKVIIWFGNAKKNGVTEAQSELFYIIVERGLIVE